MWHFSHLSRFVAFAGLLSAAHAAEPWQTTANWHRSLKKSVPGTLVLDETGLEFRSAKLTRRWAYQDIHTFDLSGRDLTLLTYENRRWHEPGERPFRFTLADAMPPEVAARFTASVARPVRNGAPLPDSPSVAQIPAHHRHLTGGSNGSLRFTNDGIDYLADSGHDSHTWRWADIETVANPNAYEFRISAFREIAEFDLKQPLPRELFEQLWDRLYASGLNLSTAPAAQEVHHQ